MNLRPNLWTVLFLLTAGWFFYTSTSRKMLAAAQDTSAIHSDSIPAAEAQQRIKDYDDQVASFLTDTTYKIGNQTLLEAMNVVASPIYFKLEAHELQEIVAKWGGRDVYAYLALKKASAPQNARDTIDLVFLSENPKNTKESTYYDFSRPCPPICGQ